MSGNFKKFFHLYQPTIIIPRLSYGIVGIVNNDFYRSMLDVVSARGRVPRFITHDILRAHKVLCPCMSFGGYSFGFILPCSKKESFDFHLFFCIMSP